MKKTVKDNVFGKITYKDGVWTGTSTINICVCDRPQEVKIEIESVNEIYDEINLGIMDKTIADIIIKNSNEYDEEQTIKDKIKQQQLFEELIIKKIKEVENNIKTAAINELKDVLQDYDIESLGKFIGREKATRLMSANTVNEKLESLQLTVMRVFKDRIEIKCICDWYKYGGGFIIIENGECLMRPIDSLSF